MSEGALRTVQEKNSQKPRPATRPRAKPAPTQLPAPAHDWKNNPLVVAAGTAAATILLCIAVVTEVVIPTQTAKLENEALKAREEVRQLRDSVASQQARGKKTDSELAALKREHEKLLKDLKAARAGNLFTQGSPYPVGLSSVRVGMSVDAVFSTYPKDQIEIDKETPTTVRVSLKGSPFASVWYMYGKNDPKRIIDNISFNLGYGHGYPESFLVEHLTEALGNPSAHPEPHYYHWSRIKGLGVYMLDEESYMVMNSRYSPALWNYPG